jgi:hypothetical protein
MKSKRGNPVEEPARYVKLNQGEGNPVGNMTNTDKGVPGKLKVPQNPANTISQKVGNPSVGKARGGADVVKNRK